MKGSSTNENIKVCIRMRPLLQPYEDEVAWTISKKNNTISSINTSQKLDNLTYSTLLEQQNLSIKDLKRRFIDNTTHSFQFDYVEDEDSKTQQIYSKIGKPITKSVLEGYNGTIFMYGQTTSGKTYTMLGTPESPGILPCAVRDIFLEINKRKDMLYRVWISYIEIYNENINDLLAPNSNNLKIQEDPRFGVIVSGAKQQQAWSFDQAIVLMNYGEEHRIYRETSIHEHSSRSHTIFRIFIESQTDSLEAQNRIHRYSCLNLVDLAGSERLGDYEGTRPESVNETGYINKSLFVLANVINKLAENKNVHIPYRDSKLTRILSQALGGNSLTAIVCTISPAALNFQQTLSTLRFATRAKIIQNQPEINEVIIGNSLGQCFERHFEFVRDEAEIKQQSVLLEQISKLQGELMNTRNEMDKLANANLEIQINLENANDKIRFLEQELSETKESLINENEQKSALEEELSKYSIYSPNNTNNDFPEKYQRLLDKYNEEKNLRIKLEKAVKNQNLNDQSNINEVSFMEQLLCFINTTFADPRNQSKIKDKVKFNEWITQAKRLGSSYKIELIAIQNKYRDELREVTQALVPDLAPEIYAFLTTLNSHSLIKEIDEARNVEIITKINNGAVFKDAKIIYPKASVALICIPSIHSQNDAHAGIRLIFIQDFNGNEVKINEEYRKCSKKLQDIYEISRTTLEVFFRRKINSFNSIEGYNTYSKTSSNIMKITEDHEEKLSKLRQLYDTEMKTLEQAREKVLSLIKPANTDQDKKLSISKEKMKKSGVKDEEAKEQNDLKSSKFSYSKSESMKIQKRENNVNKLQNTFKGKPGALLIWGSGKDGRLGTGTEKNEKYPKKIEGLALHYISCGYHHTAAVNEQGNVLTWGRNASGQLGNGTLQNELLPQVVGTLSTVAKIVQVVCGWQHTLALSTDGKIFSWGLGSEGQLGHGDGMDYSRPEKIGFFNRMFITKIAAGHSHSAAILDTGDLYMWGCNADYRLMINNNENELLPSLTEIHALQEGTDPSSAIRIVDVSLGVCHSAVLTGWVSYQGHVFTAGLGTDGQLGVFITQNVENSIILEKAPNASQSTGHDMSHVSSHKFNDKEMMEYEKYCFLHQVKKFGNPGNRAIAISCGDSYTLVLNEKNQIYTFGKSSYFRLGLGELSKDENVYEPTLIDSLKNEKIIQMSAGCRHATCINDKGEIFCWGFNFYDQLGLGDSNDYSKPTKLTKLSDKGVKMVSCGYFHTGAILENP